MIFLCGGAGNGNLGDELIVDAWLNYLTEKNIRKEIIVSGFHADMHNALFGNKYSNIKFSDILNKLRSFGPDGFFASLRRGVNFFDNGGFEKYPQLSYFSDVIKNVEIFHLHGGGYLNTIWPKNAFMLGLAVAVKKRYGARIYGTGLGILPLPTPTGDNAVLLADVMSAFDFVETRDVESFNFLKKHVDTADVTFGQDDCFLHRPTLSSAEGRQGRWLHLSDFAGSGFTEKVLGIVERTRDCFDRIVFWECMSRDRVCADMVCAAGVDVDILPLERMLNEPLPVMVGDAMLTARFHPHLLAARLGADGFFRTDKSYYDIKHRSLVVNGSPFLDIDALSNAEVIDRIQDRSARINFMNILRQEKFLSKINLADRIYSSIL